MVLKINSNNRLQRVCSYLVFVKTFHTVCYNLWKYFEGVNDFLIVFFFSLFLFYSLRCTHTHKMCMMPFPFTDLIFKYISNNFDAQFAHASAEVSATCVLYSHHVEICPVEDGIRTLKIHQKYAEQWMINSIFYSMWPYPPQNFNPFFDIHFNLHSNFISNAKEK